MFKPKIIHALSSFQNVFVMPKDQLMILAMMSLASALADPTLPV